VKYEALTLSFENKMTSQKKMFDKAQKDGGASPGSFSLATFDNQ